MEKQPHRSKPPRGSDRFALTGKKRPQSTGWRPAPAPHWRRPGRLEHIRGARPRSTGSRWGSRRNSGPKSLSCEHPRPSQGQGQSARPGVTQGPRGRTRPWGTADLWTRAAAVWTCTGGRETKSLSPGLPAGLGTGLRPAATLAPGKKQNCKFGAGEFPAPNSTTHLSLGSPAARQRREQA